MALKKRITDKSGITHTAAHVEIESVNINFDSKKMNLCIGVHHTRTSKAAGAGRIGDPVVINLNRKQIAAIGKLQPGFAGAIRNIQEGLENGIKQLELGWIPSLATATDDDDVDNDWSDQEA